MPLWVSFLGDLNVLVGEVLVKRWASVWYNAVVRGDINRVE